MGSTTGWGWDGRTLISFAFGGGEGREGDLLSDFFPSTLSRPGEGARAEEAGRSLVWGTGPGSGSIAASRASSPPRQLPQPPFPLLSTPGPAKGA